MKNLYLSFLLAFSLNYLPAQVSNFIHTSGKYILGPCNDTLTLKGINYAPYNWGYTLSDLKIDQIAQTGANVVRLAWYWSNPGASVYYNYVALDSALSKCKQYKMIAIVELHDFTCANNHTNLLNGSGWWTNSSVFPLLTKYKQNVIVNIANEALQVNWTSNPATALTAYKTTYQTIIGNLRNVSGFDFPLMIDAPDCGQNSDAFITSGTAASLITADPKHNLIFSAHAYWYGYANNDSLQMATKINNVLTQNIPFVLGEVANQQDDVTMCQYNLNYKPLLKFCQQKKVGWLAWSWDHDGCPNRQVSTNGMFNSLSTYGNDIVNNPAYGLLATPAPKSQYLLTNGACLTATLNENDLTGKGVQVYPNPSKGDFRISGETEGISVRCKDLSGHEMPLVAISPQQYKLLAAPGVYVLEVLNKHNGYRQVIRFVNME